jgi:hypothetical protein
MYCQDRIATYVLSNTMRALTFHHNKRNAGKFVDRLDCMRAGETEMAGIWHGSMAVTADSAHSKAARSGLHQVLTPL